MKERSWKAEYGKKKDKKIAGKITAKTIINIMQRMMYEGIFKLKYDTEKTILERPYPKKYNEKKVKKRIYFNDIIFKNISKNNTLKNIYAK